MRFMRCASPRHRLRLAKDLVRGLWRPGSGAVVAHLLWGQAVGGSNPPSPTMTMPTDIGIVDLGIGFPYQSIEEKKAAYDFFRANLKDAQSIREMEFPAEYMFKDVPDVVGPD